VAKRRRTTGTTVVSQPSEEDDTLGRHEKFLATERREHQKFSEEYEYTTGDSDSLSFSTDWAVARHRIPFADLKEEYRNLWAEMAIRRERLPEIDGIVNRIVRYKERYHAVERLTRVPWS
jgi:hypothetical protein